MPVGEHTISMDDIKKRPLKGYSITIGMVSAQANFNSYGYSVAAPNVHMASEIAMKVASEQYGRQGWKGFHVMAVMDNGGTVE